MQQLTKPIKFWVLYINRYSVDEALVRLHLEFGNVVWQPYMKRDSDLIEQVKRRVKKRCQASETFQNLLHVIYTVDSSFLLLPQSQIA